MRSPIAVAGFLLGCASAWLPAQAGAQAWTLEAGAVARGEYSDNYFFATVNPQSAFTTSITPFATAVRRTETSDIAAVVAVGGNWVSGSAISADYVSGVAALNTSRRDARSTWTGNVSFIRSATLQSEAQPTGGVALALAYTNATLATGAYSYALTERWLVGATASVYDNRYDGVAQNSSFQNNHGYNAGASATYTYSDAMQFVATGVYSYYASDPSRSDSATATLGIVYRLSPQLTVSATGGGFWSDTTASEGALAGESRRASGGLWGGQISYAPSAETQFGASVVESLAPSSTGLLSKVDTARVTLNSRFSDRLTGRLGGSYTRTTYPQAQTGALNYDAYQAEVGITYRLAEYWSLDAGYRYTRTSYATSDASSNVGFVSIGYNWPGSSFTSWVGNYSEVQGMPGAGPVPFPEGRRVTEPSGSSGSSSFDPFTIP